MAQQLLSNQPLSIGVFPDTTRLLEHERGDQLVELVNNSFHDGNKNHFSARRVNDLPDLVDQIGQNSFSVLVSSMPDRSGEESVPYALGSAHPFASTARPAENETPWLVRLPESYYGDSVERWELKVVCTSPAVKKQGLGSYVMDLLELEIKRRFRAQHSKDTGAPPPLRLVLTAILEQNGPWYTRRGYEVVNQVHVPKGHRIGRLSSEPNFEEFHVATMTKCLPVE
jgi:hypothetical protein